MSACVGQVSMPRARRLLLVVEDADACGFLAAAAAAAAAAATFIRPRATAASGAGAEVCLLVCPALLVVLLVVLVGVHGKIATAAFALNRLSKHLLPQSLSLL